MEHSECWQVFLCVGIKNSGHFCVIAKCAESARRMRRERAGKCVENAWQVLEKYAETNETSTRALTRASSHTPAPSPLARSAHYPRHFAKQRARALNLRGARHL